MADTLRYVDDIYDLACVLLRLDDAKGQGTNTLHRHTLHGLAGRYALLADIPEEQVRGAFRQRGFSLGAMVEHDHQTP